IGNTAYTTALPRSMLGTQARAWAALTLRFRWVRVAPLGWPVVPLVYWMTATSSACGRGISAAMASAPVSVSHFTVPLTEVVRLLRASRALAIGKRSMARVIVGMARVTSTETMVAAMSVGNA